ncbi:MAG: ATP-dependent DNA helicase, partial [Sphingomonadales bacterium]
MTNANFILKVRPMQESQPPSIPDALALTRKSAMSLKGDGSFEALSLKRAKDLLADQPVFIVSKPLARQILGLDLTHALDVLELFVFVRPAQPLVPTVTGLARALGFDAPETLEDEAYIIARAVRALFDELSDPHYPYYEGAHETLVAMKRAGWPWADFIFNALGPQKRRSRALWDALVEWEGQAPPPPPADIVLDEEAIEKRLTSLLPARAEQRKGQKHYAKAAAYAFAPREADAPNIVLAEAGTGIGKTLGYVAPASLWAERAKGTVWIATYTKALQRQIDQELSRLYPDKRQQARRAVIRKGRENYLCLLNLEEAMAQAGFGMGPQAQDVQLLALIERWARYSRDGDLIGGDFPAWLGAYFGNSRISSLTDHRGECMYTACRHYKRCFIEKSQRAAQRAQLVIANHALVMVHAVQRAGEPGAPSRFVFDEAHHLFDAADTTFSADLTGQEMRELRRWLLGPEGSKRKRGRGIQTRIGELVEDKEELREAMNAALLAAKALPSDSWLGRLRDNQPFGPAER